MVKKEFFIVDVFADKIYTGNQLAVVMGGKYLSDCEMQQIAREFNFSETTFITGKRPEDDEYRVRIFTPEEEVPFAGHPTLGTAYVIKQELMKDKDKELLLNLKAGRVPVSTDETGVLWMKQLPPKFGKTYDAAVIADILDIPKEQLDLRFPIQDVSTGLPFIIVPLKTLAALKKARLQWERFMDLIKDQASKALLIFSPQTYQPENDLSVRVFTNYYGVPEDPATGSANGCLVAYLVKHGYYGCEKVDLKVEQGYAIGRPSLLYLKGAVAQKEIEVHVGGRVIPVARGEFL